MATHLTEVEISERGAYVIDLEEEEECLLSKATHLTEVEISERGVEEEEECLLSLKKELVKASKKQTRAEPPRTIFRVPDHIRKIDPDAYDPKIISFGPYHRGKPQLQALDDLKIRYLHKILQRNPEVELEKYYRELKSLESRARSSYSDDHKVLKSDEFVKMLLLDGCFIVQLLLMSRTKDKHKVKEEEEDPMVDTAWTLPMVAFDMLKLENQLPFFILEAIFDLATAPDAGKSDTLPKLAINFFSDLIPVVPSNKSLPKFCFHLLYLFHSCMKTFSTHHIKSAGLPDQIGSPRSGRSRSGSEENGSTEPRLDRADPDREMTGPISIPIRQTIGLLLSTFSSTFSFVSSTDKPEATALSVPCATELEDAGVQLTKNKKAESFLDVKFGSEFLYIRVMRIPQLRLDDDTNELLRNLIAFEQCFPEADFYVTCYAMFMDRIIDTPSDVALLQRKGVIINCLGSDEDAAALFNKLCKGVWVDLERSHLRGLVIDVKKHWDSRMYKWRAMLRGFQLMVFNNSTAIFTLFLTYVGTICAILSYKLSYWAQFDKTE